MPKLTIGYMASSPHDMSGNFGNEPDRRMLTVHKEPRDVTPRHETEIRQDMIQEEVHDP